MYRAITARTAIKSATGFSCRRLVKSTPPYSSAAGIATDICPLVVLCGAPLTLRALIVGHYDYLSYYLAMRTGVRARARMLSAGKITIRRHFRLRRRSRHQVRNLRKLRLMPTILIVGTRTTIATALMRRAVA